MSLIENISGVDQFVEVRDDQNHREILRYVLHANEVQRFPKRVADAFLRDRGAYVHLFEETPLPRTLGEPEFWVVNMTGSPYLEKEVEITELATHGVDKGKWIKKRVANPNVKATILKFDIRQGQEREETDIGPVFWNLPPLQLHLPPAERRFVSKPVRDLLMKREGTTDPAFRGKIIETAAPSPEDPNETWPLEKLMVYGRLLDDKTFTDEFFMSVLGGKLSDNRSPEKQQEVVFNLLKWIKYRIFDPRFPRPSLESVESVLAGVRGN
jgi:hypothetical protein